MPSFDISYTYDAVGNRLTKTDNQTSEVTTYTYDGANRLLSETDSSGTTNYEYDADGNRTKKETPAATTFYEWDQENRLIEVEPAAGTVTLTYNGDGQRVKKETPTETKKFIYDFKKLLQETDGNDDTQHLFTSTDEEYGDLVSEFGEGASSYFQYDALGSADALLDANETATDRYQYQAFGLQDHTSGSSENPMTFVGRQNYYRDDELDLYMLGMGNSDGGGRQYDPTVGAFVSRDPIEDDTNLYRYARNNPVNITDASGRENPFDRAWRDFLSGFQSLADDGPRIRESFRHAGQTLRDAPGEFSEGVDRGVQSIQEVPERLSVLRQSPKDIFLNNANPEGLVTLHELLTSPVDTARKHATTGRIMVPNEQGLLGVEGKTGVDLEFNSTPAMQRTLRARNEVNRDPFNLFNPKSEGFILALVVRGGDITLNASPTAFRGAYDQARCELRREAAESKDPLVDVCANAGVYLSYVGEGFTEYAYLESTTGPILRPISQSRPIQYLTGVKEVRETVVIVGTVAASKNLSQKQEEGNARVVDYMYLGAAGREYFRLGSGSSPSLILRPGQPPVCYSFVVPPSSKQLTKILRAKLRKIEAFTRLGGNRQVTGRLTEEEAAQLAVEFVGPDYSFDLDRKGIWILRSSNGLRKVRGPSIKPTEAGNNIDPDSLQPYSITGKQVNFETRPQKGGTYDTNVHIDVEVK